MGSRRRSSMKLYEIQHINQDYNPNKHMGEELRFVSQVSNISEKFYPAEKQPKDYDHVRRLTHMLFLAWNDKNPLEGTVYLGELYNPESEDERFYKFFERFNKFTINDDQKRMYSAIKNGGYTRGGRQCGATVLLLTIAAYETIINDKFVVYFGHNQDTCNLYQREFKKKWIYTPSPYKNPDVVKFRTLNTNMDIFRGHSNARVIFDNHWLYSDFYPFKNYEQSLKYQRVTEPILDFKTYSIDTF